MLGRRVPPPQGRLRNLGYYGGPIDGSLSEATREAIRAFKSGHGLGKDGVLTVSVKNKLREVYGC